MNVKIKLSECLRPLMLGALFLGTAASAAVQPLDKVVAIVDNGGLSVLTRGTLTASS